MADFTPLSLIQFFGGAQGIVIVLAIARHRGPNRKANHILSILILLISLVLLGGLMNVNDRALVRRYPHLLFLLDAPLMAFGPLIYLYTRTLLTRPPLPNRKWQYHFLPLGLHWIHLGRYFFESNASILERLETRDFPMAPFVISFATIQLAGYLVASYRILRQFRTQAFNERSDQPVLGYLSVFLLAVAACWLAWFLSGLVIIFPNVETFQFLRPNVAWILMVLTTTILAYFAMSEKESLALIIQPKKYEGSTLAWSELRQLSERLAALMAAEKPYRQSTLSLNELADRLGAPSKDLSRVINEVHGKNFFDFVNRQRVEEFKRLATPERLATQTVLALAFEAGFNSKSTFNAACKKLTGKTPVQYLKDADARGESIPHHRQPS